MITSSRPNQPTPSGGVAGLRLTPRGEEPAASGERSRFLGGAGAGSAGGGRAMRQVCLIVLDSERLPAALWRHSSQRGGLGWGGGNLAGPEPVGGDLGRLAPEVGPPPGEEAWPRKKKSLMSLEALGLVRAGAWADDAPTADTGVAVGRDLGRPLGTGGGGGGATHQNPTLRHSPGRA